MAPVRLTTPCIFQLYLPTDEILDSCTSETRDAFRRDLGIAEEEARAAVVPKRASAQDGHWKVWETFIATYHGIDPYLAKLSRQRKYDFLQVFATRLRRGIIAPGGNPVRGRTVEDYLRTVGSEISLVVDEGDPRFGEDGLHPSIDRLQTAYRKKDPPPERVKPVPIQLLFHAAETVGEMGDVFLATVLDLLIIGFFFLLRPGEHVYSKDNNHPFRLMDVSFQSPAGTFNATTITDDELLACTRVHLEFTDQKNGEKGEAITHGDTDDPIISPFKAVARRVQHLRQHHASGDTPLHTVYLPDGTIKVVRSTDLTNMLRSCCKVIGKSLGINCKEISARALRAGGAMALLRAKIDDSTIRLMGRWKSWAMLQYLHRSAMDTTSFARRMIPGGTYTIARHATLPSDVDPSLPTAVPLSYNPTRG